MGFWRRGRTWKAPYYYGMSPIARFIVSAQVTSRCFCSASEGSKGRRAEPGRANLEEISSSFASHTKSGQQHCGSEQRQLKQKQVCNSGNICQYMDPQCPGYSPILGLEIFGMGHGNGRQTHMCTFPLVQTAGECVLACSICPSSKCVCPPLVQMELCARAPLPTGLQS